MVHLNIAGKPIDDAWLILGGFVSDFCSTCHRMGINEILTWDWSNLDLAIAGVFSFLDGTWDEIYDNFHHICTVTMSYTQYMIIVIYHCT